MLSTMTSYLQLTVSCRYEVIVLLNRVKPPRTNYLSPSPLIPRTHSPYTEHHRTKPDALELPRRDLEPAVGEFHQHLEKRYDVPLC